MKYKLKNVNDKKTQDSKNGEENNKINTSILEMIML